MIDENVDDYRAGVTSTANSPIRNGQTSILRILHEAGAITPGMRNTGRQLTHEDGDQP